ncbi:MAG: branched-chain alpha-keto acid dehydrogenase subunit E2 [Candidatus Omnitrophica bacterium]|nr:branched-chain alpha-keto acid dehydrogenase subunit E2 [Candidatus Omnitrophota bacterium]
MDIRIPRLGEGADNGTVISLFVKEGDKVEKNQTILELENEKAVAPIPASEGGVVSKVHVKVGDRVSVGQLVLTLSGGASSAQPASASQPAPRPAQAPVQAALPAVAAPVYAAPAPMPAAPAPFAYQSALGIAPPAAPSVRKIARDLGIDLGRVRGSESGGRIVLADLRDYIQYLQAAAFSAAAAPQAAQAPASVPAKPAAESIDFSKWGPVTKKPLTSLRKKIAEKMQESWNAIPHVTQNDEVDVTDIMQWTKAYGPAYEKQGAKLTLTALILKACVHALKKFPVFNSSLDEATGELVFKEYYHLGVAVDTEQGLIVPVLRDIDKKSLFEISRELGEIAEKTRQRKVSLEELKGGTFTISNLGGIGGQHFTPIVNRPEVAILGVSRGVLKPVIRSQKLDQRVLMPVSLSYDHRVIDGADGARFVREIAKAIEGFPESEIKLGGAAAKKSEEPAKAKTEKVKAAAGKGKR